MKRRLYEMKTYRDSVFSRDKAVKWYAQIMRSRKPFALAINSMVKGYDKKHQSPPYMVENLRQQLKDWKAEYKRMHNIPKSMTIQRIYRGQRIEVEVSGNNRQRAIKEIIHRIREQRQREKRITNTGTIDYKIQNRKPNGLLVEFQGKRLKLPKRPTDGADYIGIEIECITPSGVDLTPLFPFAKYVEVGGDGSIDHHGNEEGTEIRVCMRREEVRKVLPDLMQTLKDMGARINKSCGLHVHLDQRNNKEPEKVFQKLVRSLGLLYTVVPESRRQNRYCKRNRHANFNDAVRGDRYKAVNASAFHRYHTIEVRLFGGTLEATKIINWIEILLAIAYGETVMRCPKTFDTALKYWKLSEENLAWLKDRQTKFSSINAGMPVSEHETEANQMLLDETQPDPDENETCGECENALDDCSCNSECDCGDCEECNERRREDERISRRNAERRRQQAEQTPQPPSSNVVIDEAGTINLRSGAALRLQNEMQGVNNWWIGEVPTIQPVLSYQSMQQAVDQIRNAHVESMQLNMYQAMFTDPMYNNTPAETPPVESPPVTPESNDEVQF